MKSVVIFGAGIAGLSAVHELVRLGYAVSVYEAFTQPGGFFRSSLLSQDNMPTEYSWHGMGPWYHNAFDLMLKTWTSNNRSKIKYDKLNAAQTWKPLKIGIWRETGDYE